ncbi:werner syndrome-like exonuclease [Striga asiatica]|uniref:3'-5' exonuclease n=1 Tax=Striga asiatica TaxID=4170 RepID=A0A5A7PNQ0_STRAF|nr:werner syndrome-like exonuclease [Striga asiatica]
MGSESSDIHWEDFPLTDEDLRAIDSAISSAAAPKRHLLCPGDQQGRSVASPPKTRRRLPDSLFVFQNNNSSTFSFSNHERTNRCLSTFQDIKYGGRIIYSRTVEEVEKAAEELLDFVETKKRKDGECILGLDIEWKPTFTRGVALGKAAVMQICGDNSCCYVLHIFHSGIPKNLRTLLEDYSSLKVGVCIANDAAKVHHDYNTLINNLEDLSDLANQKLGGEPKKWSLSSLTEMLICRQALGQI